MNINNPTVLYFENIQSITEKQFDTFFNYLPNYRKEKILKYKFQKDKNTSLIAFLLLLYGLNITCPENIPNMCYNFGKPFFKNIPDLHFNFSHSDNEAACIISKYPCGIDIQAISNIDYNLLSYVCTPKEKELIEHSSCDFNATFTKLWSIKESYFKFTSTGLNNDINKLDFSYILDKSDCSIDTLLDFNNSCKLSTIRLSSSYLSICLHKNDLSNINIKNLYLHDFTTKFQ
ncbi:4'-phosphopantetheinyl transferase psf-1 [Clostridium saccharobutylicum]|uniref:4'-phosphopantetheinyl transferase psf-1 n=2 Tax=Clostridium saccharobutylicum TaxID=169679 RepID=A0A1S8NDQ6_CLOSA|nr:4'-phosphopantetheinyl transferase superfamily protein [Clostridium saccharobutylicum]AQS09807.1 4'-phosphopantetheinyl transferase psf-1 [Clostridium saccharobutylicum]MBC2438191.1 4'-phosphopantetheinyl transferase superfamily protein [Clostridium saccharobutylicum]NSB90673.1 4'-phosphopantetheinyl transferase [Clostridium saccharobutylicum]OOM14401.1 4'-phosphopantetheinyl transferase psf-1 [Clostridium saccharobutylicum]OOM15335.1 4'-phosphopantetheinyl transferase psf-1 [Clostridium sa